MKLYKLKQNILLEKRGDFFLVQHNDWDSLINRDHLHTYLDELPAAQLSAVSTTLAHQKIKHELLPPIGQQEVWASGVTYYKSMEARMDESKDAGGGDFYDRVYHATRPELFFKSSAFRVSGPGDSVKIRRDSTWDVPEPELTLFINSKGNIQGYTVGNDMSSRSIEGENPLYLPQAKTYDQSAALGPCLYVPPAPLPPDAQITLQIRRDEALQFDESIAIRQMKRTPEELVHFLFLECTFPNGCFLMTGTGIVPPPSFTLKPQDEITITIDHIGSLVNVVL